MEAAAALGALASLTQDQTCLQHLVTFFYEVSCAVAPFEGGGMAKNAAPKQLSALS